MLGVCVLIVAREHTWLTGTLEPHSYFGSVAPRCELSRRSCVLMQKLVTVHTVAGNVLQLAVETRDFCGNFTVADLTDAVAGSRWAIPSSCQQVIDEDSGMLHDTDSVTRSCYLLVVSSESGVL